MVFLMSFTVFSYAQTDVVAPDDEVFLSEDNSHVEISEQVYETSNKAPDFRVPSEKKIDDFRKDKRFQYKDASKITPPPSWFNKIIYQIADLFSKLFSGVVGSGALGFIAILIIIAIIVLIIFKLTGVKFRSIFGKQKLDTPPINIYTENVHEMEFDALIENALKNKDYRLVIRFMYLKNLKELTDKGIINWNINKTNYSYQHEIKDNNLRSKFLDTTFIFDYVWYGEFPVDEMNFSTAYNELNQFNEMIGK